jgi:ABC-type sugar transport system ATPase subunit
MSAIPLLKATDLSKSYGPVHALKKIQFEVFQGEVHALMGENGAGKSTLAKALTGIESYDAGTVESEGQVLTLENPAAAIKNGISIVTQEFNSIPHLSVYENVCIGHKEMFKGGFLFDKKAAVQKTKELLTLFNMDKKISPYARLQTLSVAEQQIVEIIKAVSYHSKVIFLDEPTASITTAETERLFEVVRQLKAQGVGFVIISHRFYDIFAISDRITVLRDGEMVLSRVDMQTMTEQKLVKAMVGREINDFYGDKKRGDSNRLVRKPVLEVEHLFSVDDYLKDITFQAYGGEIVGFSGLVGAGRTELMRCIFGADIYKSGSVKVNGKPIKKNSPRNAIQNKIAFATEDRKQEGLFLGLSVLINSVFVKTLIGKGIRLPHKKEVADCQSMIEKLSIKLYQKTVKAQTLSGGNQQKVVLSKWLLTNPTVFILDEPTRGIDVSVKTEIYNILYSLANQGVCVIVVSSELPEILGICDRVLIMKDGSIVKDLPIEAASEEVIIQYASFGTQTEQKVGGLIP